MHCQKTVDIHVFNEHLYRLYTNQQHISLYKIVDESKSKSIVPLEYNFEDCTLKGYLYTTIPKPLQYIQRSASNMF